MRLERLAVILIILANLGFAQSFDTEFKKTEEWRFPTETVSGYIWDSEVDEDGLLAIMFFRDGIKIISPDKVKQLAPYGQGPGDIERWMALTFDGRYLVDVEASGKLNYFEKSAFSYVYAKQGWLYLSNEFPSVKGAVCWNNKWYLSGFSVSDPYSEDVKGYYLSVLQGNNQPAKRLLFKDFKGAFRGPNLLTVHIRKLSDQIWTMFESEPVLYIISCRDDTLERTIPLTMPSFYRPIRDYWPFIRDPLSKIKIEYENWLLSYSRIENIRVNDKHLIVQLRTADKTLPTFAILFYRRADFSLENVYFTADYLLAERSGRYYFFKNGDPGLDDDANSINILVYEKK